MNNLIKSILKTAVYFLDQTDRYTDDIRDRVSDTVDRASDRISDLRDRAEELYEGESHTWRNVLTFAAGIAVGVGAGMLLAPASGEEIRGTVEWYDRTCIKVNRTGSPNLMIYKPSIKYLYKEGEGKR